MSRTVDEERREDSDRNRLERGRKKLEEFRKVLEMFEQRLSDAAIAARLGVCRDTVWKRKAALELVDAERSRPRLTDRQRREVRRRWAAGEAPTSLARAFGVSRWCVLRAAKLPDERGKGRR